ncbi:MAG: amidohydrolase family protein [Planctomycetes bacterium]|nr:amidohydrolase family protein [Planctomycetota bacterium]
MTPLIDMHVHTGGLGHGGTGCWMSEKTKNSLPFTVLRMNLGIRKRELENDLDGRLRALLFEHLDGSRHVDAVVLYAHDKIYDRQGRVREDLLQVYTPNDYVLSLARQRPGRILPAASIHPYRHDALEELDRCIAAGAVAVKWLPNSQGIDPADRHLDRFYERLARARLPLICHTGGEHTVTVIDKTLSGLAPLERPLSLGVTMVAAHSGTRSGFFDEDSFDEFVAMTRRWPKLYGDLSAWSAPNRVRHFKRLAASGINWDQVLHGSDYPVPAMPWCFLGKLSRGEIKRISGVQNPFDRDVELKRAVGIPERVFANAARLFSRRRG